MSVSATALLGAVDWASRGACWDKDPDLFFPIGSIGPALEQAARAKAICAVCDVRAACLSYALETGQDCGVWGGTTAEERRVIRSRNRRPATARTHGPPARAPASHRRPGG